MLGVFELDLSMTARLPLIGISGRRSLRSPANPLPEQIHVHQITLYFEHIAILLSIYIDLRQTLIKDFITTQVEVTSSTTTSDFWHPIKILDGNLAKRSRASTITSFLSPLAITPAYVKPMKVKQ
jgi:hypothetical protein